MRIGTIEKRANRHDQDEDGGHRKEERQNHTTMNVESESEQLGKN